MAGPLRDDGCVGPPEPQAAPARRPRSRPVVWRTILLYGLALWVLTVAALAVTDNGALVPSVIFVGSFLIPITATVWLVERQQYSGVAPDGSPSELTPLLLVAAFLGAGILGVAASSLLESALPAQPQWLFYLGVAVIEETVKIAAVCWLARGFSSYQRRDGMVLGACVGLGFAAFETAGYAFNALIQAPDESADSLLTVVGTQVVRAVLTPVGHGLWTALLAGAVFACARNGRLRLTGVVVGWWLVVVALHFVWDESAGIATWLAARVTGQPQVGDLDADATTGVLSFSVVNGLMQALLLGLCAAFGWWLAHRQWVSGRARVPGYAHGPRNEQHPTDGR